MIAACSETETLPTPGRYFYRSGAGACATFEIDEDGALGDTSFCSGAARVLPQLFSPPAIACQDGQRYAITATLDGFALSREGQIRVFVFPTMERCRQGLPAAAPSPTL